MARSRVTRSFNLVGARSVLSAIVADNGLVDWSRAIPYVEMQPPIGMSSVPARPHRRTFPNGCGNNRRVHTGRTWRASWARIGRRTGCAASAPRIRLFDVRVLGDKGQGDEFSIMAALQLIRRVERGRPRVVFVVAGVNSVTLLVPRGITNDSTGWTPVCVNAIGCRDPGGGGERGRQRRFEGGATAIGFGYDTVSITDPGNRTCQSPWDRHIGAIPADAGQLLLEPWTHRRPSQARPACTWRGHRRPRAGQRAAEPCTEQARPAGAHVSGAAAM